VPQTQRSASPAMHSIVRRGDALLSRGPCVGERCVNLGPGSAPQRCTLRRVRDTRPSHATQPWPCFLARIPTLRPSC